MILSIVDCLAGGAAQALGGPFDQYGAIGSQFSKEGPAGETCRHILLPGLSR